MSLTVGELNETIKLDNKGFNQAVDHSESKFRGLGTSIHNVASGIAPAAAAIGLSVGGIAFAAGQAVNKFTEAGHAAFEMAGKSGLALTQASAWVVAAEQVGVSGESMGLGFKYLSRNMEALHVSLATTGKLTKAQTEVFDQLDVSIMGPDGKFRDLNAVMLDVADRFQNMPDGAEKAGLAMKLFGRSGMDLLPILDRGRAGIQEFMDAGIKSGAVLSNDQVKGAQAAYLAHKQLDMVLTGLSNTFAVMVTPALTRATNAISGILGAFQKGGLKGALEQFIAPEAVEPAIESLAHAFKSIGDAFGKISSTIGSALKGPLRFVLGPDAINLWENLDGVLVAIAAVVGGILTAAFAALAITVIAATWPLLLIGAGVGLVALAAYELYKHWGTVMTVLKPFTDIVGPKLNELWVALQPALAQVQASLGPIGTEFHAAFEEWKPTLEWIGQAILTFLGGSVGALIDTLKVGIPFAISFAIMAIHNLAKLLDGVGALLRGDWGKAWTDFRWIIENTFQSIARIHIPLPHFSMHGGFDPVQWAQGRGLPGLDVSWYDKGGIFGGPSVIGVGEKRPEVVGALSDMVPLLVRAFREAQGDSISQQTRSLINGIGPRSVPVRGNTDDLLGALYALMSEAEARRSRGGQGYLGNV